GYLDVWNPISLYSRAPTVHRLRDRGEFTDLVFNHDVESFNVHRIVVCPQSKVFYKACTGGFKENFTVVIEMGHVSHVELKKMVSFFYDMDYDDNLPEETDISLLQLHARMFALADEYDIQGLSTIAQEKYSSRCAVWRPREFLESIHDVYGRTPTTTRQLRDAACMAIRKNLPKMLEDEGIAGFYEEILTEIPEFTKGLLRSYVEAPFYRECISCSSNQPMEALQARCKKCGKGNSGFHWY
ncbi:uncharacterized protein BDZ99DRAFT_548055, partial [Mytilinidion resinicola]